MTRAFTVADEVRVARKLRHGVVALETSVIGQGLPARRTASASSG